MGINLHAVFFISQDLPSQSSCSIGPIGCNVKKGHDPNLLVTGTLFLATFDHHELGNIVTNLALVDILNT
jgi:hypothetical protein